MKNAVKIVSALVAVGVAASLAACAPVTDAGTVSSPRTYGIEDGADVASYTSAAELVRAQDTSQFCGDKPVTVGWAMGVGVTWLLTVEAILQKEIKAKCPNMTLVTTDAQGDPQKANSDINSLVAQGVSGIITNPLFGDTQIPALRAAVKAGVPVVTLISDGGAVVGSDITANVPMYQVQNGVLWGDFLNRALRGEGTVVFLGGAPGQPSSLANMEAIKEAFKEYPKLKLVEEDMQPVNNDAAEVRQVVTGLLAKHGRIDAVITDNGTINVPILEAYEAAGFKPPALAVSAASNGLNCAWEARKNFPYYSTDGNHMGSVVALRRLLAEVTGQVEKFHEPTTISSWTVVDTEAGKSPACISDASPDADWSTSLTENEMKSLF